MRLSVCFLYAVMQFPRNGRWHRWRLQADFAAAPGESGPALPIGASGVMA
jgi:hypothetical protein